MAETVASLHVYVKITGLVVGDDGAQLQISETYEQSFTDGTGDEQLGTVWQDRSRALNTTSEDLDLVGSSVKDFQGQNLAFSALKVLYIRNLDLNSGDHLLVGGASANQISGLFGDVSDKIKVGPKGMLLWVMPVDGVSVSAGSDLLKVEAVDNSTYRAIIAGDNS